MQQPASADADARKKCKYWPIIAGGRCIGLSLLNTSWEIDHHYLCVPDGPAVNKCMFSISGFEKPSAIQQRAIKQIIKGRDVIAQ